MARHRGSQRPVDQPGLVADPYEECFSDWRNEERSEQVTMFLAHLDGDVVGAAMVRLPLLDNLDNAMVHLRIVPPQRGHGLGRALASQVLDVVRAQGRKRAMGMVASPMDTEAPGMGLAASLCAIRANENLRRELDLASLDGPRLEALALDLVGTDASDYRVVTWIDVAPDELVDGAACLMGRMSTDAPQGDSSWEPESWDAERYRETERGEVKRRRRRFVAGALETSTDELVAYTDIGVSTIQPTIAYQWDTVVDPAHRGHRLGLAIKIENLAQLRRESPTSARIETWNASSNSFMVSVNDALGFRPVERTTHWQLDL